MRGSLPTGTVTFVFTDIEGSTNLLHELGPKQYATRRSTSPSASSTEMRALAPRGYRLPRPHDWNRVSPPGPTASSRSRGIVRVTHRSVIVSP